MTKAFRERVVPVVLGDGTGYPILIGWGSLGRLGTFLRDRSLEGEAFLVSDARVWDLYGGKAEEGLRSGGYGIADRFLVEPGEPSKTLRNWEAVLDRLVALEDGTVRSLFLVNLGGGVVGDLGGFAAACYRRGIPFVQVPTTLLAQVDSSVGGKTGVNHPGGKNLVGAFHQPRVVVADLDTLKTLDRREIRSGLVEVIKYGLIRDAGFFALLEENLSRILALDGVLLPEVVGRSCEIKAEVVGRDVREERGLRTLLNLGHTFGHAVEAATAYGRFTHGEAVGIGILCAARLSILLGLLPEDRYGRILSLLERLGVPTRASGVDPARVWEAMKRDKKFVRGRNRFVLLEEIGRARVVEGVSPSLVSRALEAHLGSGPASPAT